MKKKSYFWLFFVGSMLSLLMLTECIYNIPEKLSVFFSFLSVIGSGVFCSALVTCLVEKQNEKNEKKQKDAQREYLLTSVRDGFVRLCERELFELSTYYFRGIKKYTGKPIRETILIKDVGEKICSVIEKIEEYEDEILNSDEVFVKTDDTLKLSEEKMRRLISNSIIYYESLLQHITNLSNNFPLCLSSGIFCENQIDDMRTFMGDIQDVIRFSSESDLYDGTLLEFKKILFKRTVEILQMLDMTSESTVSCYTISN